MAAIDSSLCGGLPHLSDDPIVSLPFVDFDFIRFRQFDHARDGLLSASVCFRDDGSKKGFAEPDKRKTGHFALAENLFGKLW